MRKLNTTLLALSSLLKFPSPIFAQEPVITVGTPNLPITDLGEFVTGLVDLLIIFAALIVFIYLVWGGIQWITSGGDKGKTQEARDRITAALVGLAIVAASWAIMRIVNHFLGIGLGPETQLPTGYGNT